MSGSVKFAAVGVIVVGLPAARMAKNVARSKIGVSVTSQVCGLVDVSNKWKWMLIEGYISADMVIFGAAGMAIGIGHCRRILSAVSVCSWS
jgi:hypothetical protein